MSCFFSCSGSSGRISSSATSYPAALSISAAAGPLSSARSPLAPLSLRVITAAWSGRSAAGGSARISSPGRITPSWITLANTPSLGMMHSPIRLKMAQWLWHSLPIWVISSTAVPE